MALPGGVKRYGHKASNTKGSGHKGLALNSGMGGVSEKGGSAPGPTPSVGGTNTKPERDGRSNLGGKSPRTLQGSITPSIGNSGANATPPGVVKANRGK